MAGDTNLEKLKELKSLLDEGVISQDEFDTVKSQLLEAVGQDAKNTDAKQEDQDASHATTSGMDTDKKSANNTKWLVLVGIAALIAFAVLFFGYSSQQPKYKGNVAGAIAYCQNLKTTESCIIEVTGYASLTYGDNNEYFHMYDGSDKSHHIIVKLDGKGSTSVREKRVTVRGKATGATSSDTGVFLTNAKIV